MENEFTEGQHTHFYGEVERVTIHNTMHNHYQERPQGGQDMKIDLDKKPMRLRKHSWSPVQKSLWGSWTP